MTVGLPVSSIASGVVFVKDVVPVGIACGRAVIASDHDVSMPVLPAASSDTRRVQVPFGFSPMNAPSASSGASVGATSAGRYSWSDASPSLKK